MKVVYNEDSTPYYSSPDEFLAEDDILEIDITIVGYKGKFRIRALTFEQMEKINAGSRLTNGVEDTTEFALLTLLYGVTRPRFNAVNVRKMLDKNGAAVRELVDAIWALGQISKETFHAYVESVKVDKAAEGAPESTAT